MAHYENVTVPTLVHFYKEIYKLGTEFSKFALAIFITRYSAIMFYSCWYLLNLTDSSINVASDLTKRSNQMGFLLQTWFTVVIVHANYINTH